mmetsp:Transcript_26739/g.37636  ORF Transcript_26739/g.37636 Transcript_26739/m.37636 type:complete len:333 (-) Transcript_26739:79-1077(-)
MKPTFVLALVALLAFGAYAQSTAYYQELVDLPSNIRYQGSYSYLKSSTMLNMWGEPCPLTTDCTTVTNTKLKAQIVTRTIGKFRVTGMSRALDALERALNKVQYYEPSLYAVLGNSGMLCCRAIRGSSSSWSNHSWGAAIDFNIGGQLDPRGDGAAQRGLHELYPYMHAEGFYWAAGYSGSSEDAMHFEIANEVMLTWGSSGSSSGTSGTSGGGSSVSYVCVNANSVNVRSGPCTTYSKIGSVSYGDVVELLSSSTPSGCGYYWYKIRDGSTVGYIATNYAYSCTPRFQSSDNETIEDSFDNFDYEAAQNAVGRAGPGAALVLSGLGMMLAN